MKINIEFDGSVVKTFIDGKPIHKCLKGEHYKMLKAFNIIERDLKRENYIYI